MPTKVNENQDIAEVQSMNDVLTGAQERVIAEMLAGKTQKQAATEAGVRPETVSRWLARDALFVATLNTARMDMWDGRIERLRGLTRPSTQWRTCWRTGRLTARGCGRRWPSWATRS